MNPYELMIESLKETTLPYSIGSNPYGGHTISVWFQDGIVQFMYNSNYELIEIECAD